MRHINTFQFSFVLVLALLFNACKAPEAYRSALEAFSQGAAVEMKDHFPTSDTHTAVPNNFMGFDDFYKSKQPIDPDKVFASYYQEALDHANKALKGSKQLKKYNILDNAFAIKALILWRQEQYQAADSLAKTAEPMLKNNSKEENDIRDLAMMQALPGLINVEKAYAQLENTNRIADDLVQLSTQSNEKREAVYLELKEIYQNYIASNEDGASSVTRGLALIERAIENVDDNSAIIIYLRNAQLAAVKTWSDMHVDLFTTARRLTVSDFAPEDGAWIQTEKQAFEQKRDFYLAELAKLLPNGKTNKLYIYWTRIL